MKYIKAFKVRWKSDTLTQILYLIDKKLW
jgi:hypothetical protein